MITPDTPLRVRWTKTETTTYEATLRLDELVHQHDMATVLAELGAGAPLETVLDRYESLAEQENEQREVMYGVQDRSVDAATPPTVCGECGDPLPPDSAPGVCPDCREQQRLATELAAAESRVS